MVGQETGRNEKLPFLSLTFSGFESLEPILRLANGLRQFAQKFRRAGAVDHPMITSERYRHHWPNTGLAIDGNHPIGDGSNREYGGLRGRNDGAEGVNLVHPEIAERKGPSANIGREQTPCARSLREATPLCGYLTELRTVSFAYHCPHDTAFDGHGHADVDLSICLDSLSRPTRIHNRVLHQNTRYQRHK